MAPPAILKNRTVTRRRGKVMVWFHIWDAGPGDESFVTIYTLRRPNRFSAAWPRTPAATPEGGSHE